MKLTRMLPVLALLLALAPFTVNAAKVDKGQLGKVWKDVEVNLKNVKMKVETQIEAVEKLNGKLDRATALKLLAYFDSCDNAYKPAEKGKTHSGRPKEAFKVAIAMLAAVASMTDGDEAVLFREDIPSRDKYPLRTRMAMVDAIYNCAAESKTCHDYLMDGARNCPENDARVLITLALKRMVSEEAVANLMFELLNDRSWRVRDAAAECMVAVAQYDRDKAILALINRLYNEEGKLRENIARALQDITGEKLGANSDAWCDWWEKQGKPSAGLPPHKGAEKATSARVFGTETFSNRFIFLIDASVSMTERISAEEKERLQRSFPGTDAKEADGRRPLDWSKINTKLDLAREELIRSLEIMDPKKTSFTIVSFSDDVKIWKDELVPCDADNRADAGKWLTGLRGKSRTNVFGALEAAFDYAERLAGIDPKKKGPGGKVLTGPHPDEVIPDTIFIYTDGFATEGKYCGDSAEAKKIGEQKYAKIYAEIMQGMMKEVSDRNRVARIQINAVGVGRQDRKNLSQLANDNRGSYVALAP